MSSIWPDLNSIVALLATRIVIFQFELVKNQSCCLIIVMFKSLSSFLWLNSGKTEVGLSHLNQKCALKMAESPQPTIQIYIIIWNILSIFFVLKMVSNQISNTYILGIINVIDLDVHILCSWARSNRRFFIVRILTMANEVNS